MSDVEADKGTVTVRPPSRGGIDRRIFGWINNLPHSPASDRQISAISDLGKGLGWAAAGAGLALLGGSRGRRAGVATALASLAATYIVQEQIKPRFRRVRPFIDREARVVGIRPVDHSFPSGHTASSFAAATVLSIYYPKATPLVVSLSTAVGLSRVHLGVHFPSDVAVGALIGIGLGALSAGLFKVRR